MGPGTCAVTKVQKKKLDVVEMRMARWMFGLWNHKAGQNRNERITGTTEMGEISKCRKVTEKTVLVGKRVMVIDVPRTRRPKAKGTLMYSNGWQSIEQSRT